jgi:3',5'-nucleoside bisphosphate phosphatase
VLLCDLHLHTTKSDGVWAPERLFDEVRARGLQYFSVTDHDCIDAYPVPEDLRDRVIPGLEVDSEHAGHTVHILAYGIDDKESPLLQALCAQHADRLRRMERMVHRLNVIGLPVHIEDVVAQAVGTTSLGRPHLARALVAKGCVDTVQEAFDKYIADDGDGYVALKRLTSGEVIDLTHRSGGVAVIAHPLRLRSTSHIEQLVALGVDGIEVIHPTADAEDNLRLRSIAAEHCLLVTGGTDFHGPVDGTPIGAMLESAEIERLCDRIALTPRRSAL